jgi:molybdopterin-containing oxidoreductase family membrane subunit
MDRSKGGSRVSNQERSIELENKVLAPLVKPSAGYNIVLAILAVIVGIGVVAWFGQLRHGLTVTGLQNQVFWGLYITTFVYFIGISLAGTLVSAVLRLTGQHWQTPITRIAEIITGAALIGAALMILVDMGRPERLLNVFIYGRIQSPLIWDVIALNTYLFGSLLYLYIPMIPDLALCRDRLSESISPIRHKIYSILALGWQNTHEQKERLEKAINVMSVVIIPAGIAVHSVTAWLFGMTLRVGWDNTILAPYFVTSAFFSGVAMVIVVMSIYRKAFGLEKYFTQEMFVKLGWLLLTMALVYAYFNFAELLTEAYKLKGSKEVFLAEIFTGKYAIYFWMFFFANILTPIFLVSWSKTRNITGITIAGVLVIIGVWFKRYIFVIPTLSFPMTPTYYNAAAYSPSLAEWAITIIGLAGFALMIGLFFRIFPVMPVWEVAHEWEKSPATVTDHSLRFGAAKGGK